MKIIIPIALIFGFFLLLIHGVSIGDVAEVVLNATLLCLHCIGIG